MEARLTGHGHITTGIHQHGLCAIGSDGYLVRRGVVDARVGICASHRWYGGAVVCAVEDKGHGYSPSAVLSFANSVGSARIASAKDTGGDSTDVGWGTSAAASSSVIWTQPAGK